MRRSFALLSATVAFLVPFGLWHPALAGGPPAKDSSELVSADLPATLVAGAQATATVTMRNKGTTTWTKASGYRLGGVGDKDPLYPASRVDLPDGVSVGPGKTYAFSVPLTAPAAAGTYTTSWQMLREHVHWFGAAATKAVVVTAPVVQEDDATIVATELPTTLATGAKQHASVTVKNTGSATWIAGSHRLGAVDDSDPFAPTRIDLPQGTTVAPGATWKFDFDMTAPGDPRTYTTDWRMVHENVRWFGETAKVDVSVTGDRIIDPATLQGKLIMGYQGWFSCKGDGSPSNDWGHWTRGGAPNPKNLCVDLWPDTSELDADELFDTDLALGDGSRARVFSSFNKKTVDRHFKWMKDYGIDGVTVGRFLVGVNDPTFIRTSATIIGNIRAACEKHGRTFFIAYDVTGHDDANLVQDMERDWKYLVDTLKVTESPSYQRHAGRPALMVWGIGGEGHPGTPQQAMELVRFFHDNPDPRYRASIVAGVSAGWRTLEFGSKTDPAWKDYYTSVDVVNPWLVAAFANESQAAGWYNDRLGPDAEDCRTRGQGYMPTIFPGFSWKNLQSGNSNLNGIPRRGGSFYWSQAYWAAKTKATCVLNAMFDEVDEGTAMFKVVARKDDLPQGVDLVSLDIDGQALPSDWYLRLAGEAAKMLRGAAPLSEQIPIKP